MKALRKGGGLTAFRIEQVDAEAAATGTAMVRHRFRSIETAASEEVSVGWVRPGDPSGGQVDPELLGDDTCWLQFRRDIKKLPGARLQLELDGFERANGRRLSARQRREAKDEIRARLLPTWPTTTRITDVLVRGDRALLLSTSQQAVEDFAALWRDTFGAEPAPLTPTALAGDGWESLRPTPFARVMRQQEIQADADFLGAEFLTWLWWRQDSGAQDRRAARFVALVEDRLQFGAVDSDAVASSFRGTFAPKCPEARAALRGGALLDRARVSIGGDGPDYWQATLDAARMRLASVVLPPDDEDDETAEDKTHHRAGAWFRLQGAFEHLFGEFLAVRRSAGWDAEAGAMGAWMQS